MGHGANNHFDILLNSAGGKDAIAGDYLYRSRPALGFRYGLWGAFRVAEKGKDAVSITANAAINPATTPYTLFGFNTVNPETGKLAATVKVYANGVRTGSGCSGSPVTVNVNQTKGSWNFTLPLGTNKVCVESALGGVDSLTFPDAGVPNGSFKNACTENPGQNRPPAGVDFPSMISEIRTERQASSKSFDMTKIVTKQEADIKRAEVTSEDSEENRINTMMLQKAKPASSTTKATKPVAPAPKATGGN
jgi:hypothetical protein